MPETRYPPSASLPESCPLLEDLGAAKEWTACCSRHFRPVARCIVGEDSLAENALQGSWVKVLQGIHGFRGGKTACHWVRAIVANKARDIRRAQRRVLVIPEVPEAELKDPAPSPEDLAIDRQMLAELRELAGCLPEPYRQVMRLRLEQELSTSETARQLGISGSNAATRLGRSLRKLRDRLEARERREKKRP